MVVVVVGGVAPGTVVVVDVVVVVVVEVTTVAAVLSMGHEVVAAVGRICSGCIFSGTVVGVEELFGVGITVVVVGSATVSSVMASASESAGATAGGSL